MSKLAEPNQLPTDQGRHDTEPENFQPLNEEAEHQEPEKPAADIYPRPSRQGRPAAPRRPRAIAEPLVVVNQRRHEYEFTCPICGYRGPAGTSKTLKPEGWVCVIVACLFFWPAMFYPFCIDDCYDTQIACPINH